MTREDDDLEIFSRCDGCGAHVPLEQLSLVTFIELDGFTCEECKRETLIIGPVYCLTPLSESK